MSEMIRELQIKQQGQRGRHGVMEAQVLNQNEDDFHRTWNESLNVADKKLTTAQVESV